MMKKQLVLITIVSAFICLAGCSKAGEHINRAENYKQKEEYSMAAVEYQKAIEKASNRADYYIDYALCLLKMEQYNEAMKQANFVIRNNDVKIVLENNKRATMIKGIGSYKLGLYKDAEMFFLEALDMKELQDLNKTLNEYLADTYVMQAKYNEANEIYDKLLEGNTKEASLYSKKGTVLYYMQDYSGSIDSFDKALAINANDYSIYLSKYLSQKALGLNTEAKESLSHAVKIEPKNDTERFYLAKTYFYLEDYEKAEAEMNACVTAGRNEAYFYLGQVSLVDKDYNTAIYNFEKYLEQQGDASAALYNQLGNSYMKKEDYKSAVTYLSAGIESANDTEYQSICKNLIISYEKLGMFDDAYTYAKAYEEKFGSDNSLKKEIAFIETRIKQEIAE